MPNEPIPAARIVADAASAVDYARGIRRHHARKSARDDPQRVADVERALALLRSTMKPLRGLIARFPFISPSQLAGATCEEIRDVSTASQRERRKLWKMRNRETDA